MMQTGLSQQIERNVTSRQSQRNFSYFDRSFGHNFKSQTNLEKDIAQSNDQVSSKSPDQKVSRFK